MQTKMLTKSPELKYVIDQMNLTDIQKIFQTFHSTAVEHIILSSVNDTVPKNRPVLGYKASLDKYKKIKPY